MRSLDLADAVSGSLFAAVCGLTSLACSGSQPQGHDYQVVQSSLQRDAAPNVAPADAAQLSKDNAAFAFDLYRGVVKDETSNVFYSPYSVSLALAMTYAGAAGETAQQLAGAMHFALPPDRLHPAFDALDLALESRAHGQAGADGKGFKLNLADSLWGDQRITFQHAFLDTLAVSYGSGLRVADFVDAPDTARGDINGWVSDETSQKIPELLPKGTITSDTRFVLVNAIYFNAGWATQFDPTHTQTAPFTRLDGTTVQANEMQDSEGSYTYAEGSGYQAVELPYDGSQTSMVVILPAAGQFASVEQGLTGDFLGSVFGALAGTPVALSLPRFTVHGPTISLKDQLIALGATDAFDPARADFSNMIAGKVWIGDVLHQAFVKVDETGTEAAAATAVIGVGAVGHPGGPKVVNVNRPFFFVIRDIPTNTALFIGRVMDPTAQ